MIKWLIKAKMFIFGYKTTPEEKETEHQEAVKRKAHILGATAGLHGVQRIDLEKDEGKDDEDNEVRPAPDS